MIFELEYEFKYEDEITLSSQHRPRRRTRTRTRRFISLTCPESLIFEDELEYEDDWVFHTSPPVLLWKRSPNPLAQGLAVIPCAMILNMMVQTAVAAIVPP